MRDNLVECASVPCRLPEGVAKDVDKLCKGLPSGLAFQRKTYTPSDVHFEPNERAEVSILTTATVDKTNEIVLPENVELDAYRRSKVVLYNHDPHAIVGENQWIKYVPKDRSIRGKTLYFANSDNVESNWYKFVDETWLMVRAGALKAKSIGFQPLKPLRGPTPEELALHPEWEGVGVWDSSLLLEYSVCPVGINNDALVEVVNRKSMTYCLKAMGLELPGEEVDLGEECQNVINQPAQNVISQPTQAKAVIVPKRNLTLQLAKALGELTFDPERILALAEEMHRHRGRA